MRLLRFIEISALAAVVCVTTDALAAPTAKDKGDARAALGSARKAMREKRFAEAVEALRRADQLDPSPALQLELAQAMVAAGKLVDASRLLKVIAGESAPAAKKARDGAVKALADLGPRVPTIQVTVSGAPAAKVTTQLDGSMTDLASEVPVDPGEHTVGATAEGFVPANKSVRIAERARERVALELVAVARDKPVEASGGSRTPGIVLASIGGAGVVAGAIFGGLAFSAAGTAKDQCVKNLCPPSAQGDIDRSKTFGTVSTATLIGGGVIAVTGILLAIAAPFGKSDPPKGSAQVSPWIGAGSVGLSGRF